MELTQIDRTLIKANSKVIAKGVRVGSVELIDGDYLKLNRKDSDDRLHHWIPLTWVERIEENTIHINQNPAEFKSLRRNSKPIL
jgi:hypothetical protein